MTAPSDHTHATAGFMCGTGFCLPGYAKRPDHDIAAMIAEDSSEWFNALSALDDVPDGVVEALTAASQAAAGWSDLLRRKHDSAPTPPIAS